MERYTLETKANPTFKRIVFALLIGFSSVLGVYALPVLLVLPAFIAFVAVAWGYAGLASALVGVCAGLYLGYGADIAAVYDAALVILPSAVLVFIFKGKRPYRTGAAGTAAAFGLGLYALLCLPSMLSGGSPFDAIKSNMAALASSAVQLINSLPQAESAMGVMLEYVELLPDIAAEVAVMFIVCASMAFGFIDVLTTRALIKKARAELRPMAPMRLWQVSKSFTWGAVVLIIGSFIISYMNIVNAGAIGIAIQFMVMLPYALVGVCFMEFMNTARKRGAGIRVVGAILALLLLPYSIYALAVLGLIDRMLRIRDRIINPPSEY